MFVNQAFAQKHKLETHPLPNPVPVHNIDGTPNENRSITEEVEVILQYGQHTEKVCLAVTNLRQQTIIIGHLWLTHHNPEVDWARQSVTMSQCPPECQGQSNGGMAEDDGPEPRDAIYATFIPPEWVEHHISAMDTPSQWLAQEAQKAEGSHPLRTWCWPNTTTSEMPSPRKPLMSSHHGSHGTTPLLSHLRLNPLAPRCSPYPLQNRRSLMTSSRKTL